ncbi:unnamed protein product, partial [Iphiclides podalirius]
MEIYLVLGIAVLIYTLVTLFINSKCWNPEDEKCQCEECKNLCQYPSRNIAQSVLSVSSRIDIIERQ